jgi:hypothetical protein
VELKYRETKKFRTKRTKERKKEKEKEKERKKKSKKMVVFLSRFPH